MRLKQLAERRVAAAGPRESLCPLSAQEIRQVAGAQYYVVSGPHEPIPPQGSYPGPGEIAPRFVEL
jgi:hypothetical protein